MFVKNRHLPVSKVFSKNWVNKKLLKSVLKSANLFKILPELCLNYCLSLLKIL